MEMLGGIFVLLVGLVILGALLAPLVILGLICYQDITMPKKGYIHKKIPEDFNIHWLRFDKEGTRYGPRFGPKWFYLETKDGFIDPHIEEDFIINGIIKRTRYVPSEMKNVTAIYLDFTGDWHKRIDINEIVSFDVINVYTPEEMEHITKDCAASMIWDIKIQTNSNSYRLVNIGDTNYYYDYRIWYELQLNDHITEEEKCNKMAEVSCMWALKKHINDLHHNG